MKAKGLILIVIFFMKFSEICYAHEIESEGIWTYVSASIPYELEGMQTPPETAILRLKDDITGLEYEREVPLKEITEKEQIWTDGFSCPITISGYDADVFLLGETEISADEDLVSYGEEILEAAGLSPDYYRIESVEWLDGSYEADGILFRDAMAKGEKLIRRVDVLYGGQVRVPDRETDAEPETVIQQETEAKEEKTTTDLLDLVPKETEEVRLQPKIVKEPELSPFANVLQWVREHLLVVTVGIGVIIVLFGAALLGLYEQKKSRD